MCGGRGSPKKRSFHTQWSLVSRSIGHALMVAPFHSKCIVLHEGINYNFETMPGWLHENAIVWCAGRTSFVSGQSNNIRLAQCRPCCVRMMPLFVPILVVFHFDYQDKA